METAPHTKVPKIVHSPNPPSDYLHDDIKRPGKEDKVQALVIPFDYVNADWLPRALKDTAERRKKEEEKKKEKERKKKKKERKREREKKRCCSVLFFSLCYLFTL